MDMTRRWFIGGAGAYGAFAGSRLFADPLGIGRRGAPLLRFGVISDIHCIAENTDRIKQGNTATLRHALKWYDEQGADAIVIAGDLADAGLISQLQVVADAWYAVFPNGKSRRDGRAVEKVFVTGNHDWNGWMSNYSIYGVHPKELVPDHLYGHGLDRVKRVWREMFDEDYEYIYRKTVKGYDFIGAHWDLEGTGFWTCGGPPTHRWFEKHGKTIDPSKPFFYVQHPHPKDTCYGPWAWGHDKGVSTKALSAYSNAVAFSGHSHYSLVDERTVWQGAFTSVGTGSLRYEEYPQDDFAKDDYCENMSGWGSTRAPADKLLPVLGRGPERNGLLVEVRADSLTIARRDFVRDRSLGPDWTTPLPSAEAKPFAFGPRAKRSVGPNFSPTAKLTLTRGKAKTRGDREGKGIREVDSVILSFPLAVASFETRPWSYDMTCRDAAGKEVLHRRLMAPDVGVPVGCAQTGPDGKPITGLTLPVEAGKLPKGDVKFEVVARNCFGVAGRPLELTRDLV